ncbi:MAG: PUR family DNA/RNA-binding protein [Flavobacteriaceae bacterium]
MQKQENQNLEEIYSKVLRAGRRTYFFDVRETKASDYYLTITESKKFTNEDGTYYYKKHKIYLYKEDFNDFTDILEDIIQFIFKERGEEVISEKHQKDYSSNNINSDSYMD